METQFKVEDKVCLIINESAIFQIIAVNNKEARCISQNGDMKTIPLIALKKSNESNNDNWKITKEN